MINFGSLNDITTVEHPTKDVTYKPGPWVLVAGIDQAVPVLEGSLREPQSRLVGFSPIIEYILPYPVMLVCYRIDYDSPSIALSFNKPRTRSAQDDTLTIRTSTRKG